MDPLYELLGQTGAITFFQDDSDTASLTCLRLSAELGVTATLGEDRGALQRRCVVMAILRQHFIRGEYISCVRLVLAELRNSQQGDMALRWWLVRLSISMGDLQSARKHVSDAIAADSSPSASTSFDALLHSGLVAVSCAQYPAAQEFFDRAVRLKPGNSAAAVNLSISNVRRTLFEYFFAILLTRLPSHTSCIANAWEPRFQILKTVFGALLCCIQRLFQVNYFLTTSHIREFGGDFLDSSVVANLAGL